MKRFRFQFLIFIAAMGLAAAAPAQTLPSTIRIFVPFTPSGPVDFMGRVLADGLRAQLKSVVVVENRPGANGAVAMAALKQAPLDGGTLLFVSSGMITFSPHFEKALPYDPVRDLAPVASVAYADVGLVAANNVPANNLREFIALARSSAKPLAMGSAGTGNITHAYIELLKGAAGVDLLHVPYKGASPALSDVMGGQIAGMFIALSTALPSVKAGKVKALAVVGNKRSAIAPEIPTLTEQGFPGVEILPWFGLMAPAGLPPETIGALARAVKRAVDTDETRKKLLAAGATPWVLSGDDFSRMIRTESDTWQRLIAERKMKSE